MSKNVATMPLNGELTAEERSQLGAQVKAELVNDVNAMLALAKSEAQVVMSREMRISRLETRLLIGASTAIGIGVNHGPGLSHVASHAVTVGGLIVGCGLLGKLVIAALIKPL